MAEIITECDNCKHVMTDTESFPCNRCTRNAVDKWEPIPKQTNADRIRSMNDIEMSMDLIPLIMEICEDGVPCEELFLIWLQSEAE